jgi:LPXTG-motif cell wall-anchored protein
MKKYHIILSLSAYLALTSLTTIFAQEGLIPEVDNRSLSGDSEKNASSTIAFVVGGVIVLGGAAFLIFKKRSN